MWLTAGLEKHLVFHELPMKFYVFLGFENSTIRCVTNINETKFNSIIILTFQKLTNEVIRESQKRLFQIASSNWPLRRIVSFSLSSM